MRKKNHMANQAQKMQEFREITRAAIERAIGQRVAKGMSRRAASRDLVRCMLRNFNEGERRDHLTRNMSRR